MTCTPRPGHWELLRAWGVETILVIWASVFLLSMAQTHGSQDPRLFPVRVRGRGWMSGL